MFRHPKSSTEKAEWPAYMTARAAACSDPELQRFYATPMPASETPIAEVPLMAVDIETTGLESRRGGIVSIGMVPFTLERIRPGAGYYRVLKPRWPLRDESVTYHRITHSEIAHAPDLDVVLPEILQRLAGHVAVVHFRNIERAFLDRAVRVRRGESWLFPMIDTMEIEARWQRESFWARLRKLLGRQSSIRLQDSRSRYGLPAYQAHHALTDALATAELFQAQIARRYAPDTPLSRFWG